MSDSPKRPEMPGEVVAALTAGNKIEAIKLLREARGIGLKEAKDQVEAYIETQPALKQQLASKTVNASGCLKWILFAAIIAAIYYYLRIR